MSLPPYPQFLDEALARDVRASLQFGIGSGAVFERDGSPDELFTAAIKQAITAIESRERSALLRRFLSVGPYTSWKDIPPALAAQYMSDAEVAAAIRFVFSSVINTFQGQLAEMLAVKPVTKLAREAFALAEGATGPRVFVGDTVRARPMRRKGWAKGADFHLLEQDGDKQSSSHVMVHGVVEVKSYAVSPERLLPQLNRHLMRATRGLEVVGAPIGPGRIRLGDGARPPARVVVTPDTWKLPRRFWFEDSGDRSFLMVEPPKPPAAEDRVTELAPGFWGVTLRWSQEALADAAHALTFWYMGELGKQLYEHEPMPEEWAGMSAEEAGRNAAKMMLYYAILRARTAREASRATALYNSYGFGYALGSNFVDWRGRREVLFFEDLHEILEHGRSRLKPVGKETTAQRCRIRGLG